MDLHHAACAVQGVHRKNRIGFCDELIWKAHVADKYVKRLHKLHPQWGDGSLRAVALQHQPMVLTAIEPSEFLACLSIVLRALLEKSAVRSTPY